MVAFLSVVVTVLCLCIGSPGMGSLNSNTVLPNRLGKFNFEELESSIYRVVLAASPVVEEENREDEEPQERVESDEVVDVPSDVKVTKSVRKCAQIETYKTTAVALSSLCLSCYSLFHTHTKCIQL